MRSNKDYNAYQRKYYKKRILNDFTFKIKKQLSNKKGLENNYRSIRNLIESLKNVPCLDCKNSYPFYVMEFDHCRGSKKFNISDCRSIKKILEEIKKCDIICANCHAIRTWERKTKKCEVIEIIIS